MCVCDEPLVETKRALHLDPTLDRNVPFLVDHLITCFPENPSGLSCPRFSELVAPRRSSLWVLVLGHQRSKTEAKRR